MPVPVRVFVFPAFPFQCSADLASFVRVEVVGCGLQKAVAGVCALRSHTVYECVAYLDLSCSRPSLVFFCSLFLNLS